MESGADPDSTEEAEEVVVFRPGQDNPVASRSVLMEQTEAGWILSGNPRLEQMVRQTDFSNFDAKERIYDVLRKWHVVSKLTQKGAISGDKLFIGKGELEFRG